jgi:hypothetical protein
LLSLVGVDFTQFALKQVSTLSFLEDLDTVYSIAPPKTDSLPMLRPRTFACLGGSNPDNWLALIDPDHLQALRVSLTEIPTGLGCC